MAQDILQLNELQHKVEAVPEQEWVEAIKVQMGSDAFVVSHCATFLDRPALLP